MSKIKRAPLVIELWETDKRVFSLFDDFPEATEIIIRVKNGSWSYKPTGELSGVRIYETPKSD